MEQSICNSRHQQTDRRTGDRTRCHDSNERDPEACVGFLRGGTRPLTESMVSFVNASRDEFGVEPICQVLQAAPNTYYAAKSRKPSARTIHGTVTAATMLTVFKANYSAYGVHKMWKALQRAGTESFWGVHKPNCSTRSAGRPTSNLPTQSSTTSGSSTTANAGTDLSECSPRSSRRNSPNNNPWHDDSPRTATENPRHITPSGTGVENSLSGAG